MGLSFGGLCLFGRKCFQFSPAHVKIGMIVVQECGHTSPGVGKRFLCMSLHLLHFSRDDRCGGFGQKFVQLQSHSDGMNVEVDIDINFVAFQIFWSVVIHW